RDPGTRHRGSASSSRSASWHGSFASGVRSVPRQHGIAVRHREASQPNRVASTTVTSPTRERRMHAYRADARLEAPPDRGFRLDIQGLRAVAVVLVLAY